MPPRPSRWKAQHVGCQKAADNVKTDLTKEIERLQKLWETADSVAQMAAHDRDEALENLAGAEQEYERLQRIANTGLDEIEDALRPLLGLTKAEMQIAGIVQWARNALMGIDAATPACQDCGMRHETDDRASCIEGHGDDAEWGEDSAAQK